VRRWAEDVDELAELQRGWLDDVRQDVAERAAAELERAAAVEPDAIGAGGVHCESLEVQG
jgi:hypothetical protein